MPCASYVGEAREHGAGRDLGIQHARNGISSGGICDPARAAAPPILRTEAGRSHERGERGSCLGPHRSPNSPDGRVPEAGSRYWGVKTLGRKEAQDPQSEGSTKATEPAKRWQRKSGEGPSGKPPVQKGAQTQGLGGTGPKNPRLRSLCHSACSLTLRQCIYGRTLNASEDVGAPKRGGSCTRVTRRTE